MSSGAWSGIRSTVVRSSKKIGAKIKDVTKRTHRDPFKVPKFLKMSKLRVLLVSSVHDDIGIEMKRPFLRLYVCPFVRYVSVRRPLTVSSLYLGLGG